MLLHWVRFLWFLYTLTVVGHPQIKTLDYSPTEGGHNNKNIYNNIMYFCIELHYIITSVHCNKYLYEGYYFAFLIR